MKPIIKRESNQAYHANTEFVGSSTLKLYKRSPLHKKQGIDSTSEALIFGGAYHCFVLEPDVFEDTYFIFDDRYEIKELLKTYSNPRGTKKYTEFKENEMLKATGRIVINIDDFLLMREMKKMLFSHRFVYWLFNYGENEISHYMILDGVKVKIKPDSLHKKARIIADLKTTTDASLDNYYHEAAKRSYHISGALYCDVAEAIYTESLKAFDFFLICQEKTPPYAVAIYRVTYNFLAIGRYEYELCLQQHKYCEETGIYRGYEVFANNKFGIRELGFPPYKNREYYFYNQFDDPDGRKYLSSFEVEEVTTG